MTSSRRLLACVLVVCGFALTSCGKSDPPAPAKTAAAPPLPQRRCPLPAAAPAPAPPKADPNAAVKRAASEVWIFAFPLVLTDVTREVQSAGRRRTRSSTCARFPMRPTATVAQPNADFLYSQAWLDLSKGPVVLTVPETKGRYYLLALLDGYTNVAASIGKRTTGTEKRQFAIVGPDLQGHAPRGHVRGQVAYEPRVDLRAHRRRATEATSPTPQRSRTSTSSAGPRAKGRAAKGCAPAKGRRPRRACARLRRASRRATRSRP